MVHASMASMGEASQRHWYTRSYVYEGIWQLTLKKMEAGSCSLWLPASAWALVYQHLDDATRRALLSLCQTTRDAVLQEASGISLKVTDEANLNLQPFARLLARASRLSAAGLALSIQGTCSISSLLISALNGSTWEAVQHLELKASINDRYRAMLFPKAVLSTPNCHAANRRDFTVTQIHRSSSLPPPSPT
jgi:hypothetical protein